VSEEFLLLKLEDSQGIQEKGGTLIVGSRYQRTGEEKQTEKTQCVLQIIG
jgi:6-phosphofructokinase